MRFVGKYSKLKKGQITATFGTTRIDAILICRILIVHSSIKVTIITKIYQNLGFGLLLNLIMNLVN